MRPQAAVLTGDLIGSTEAPPASTEAAMALIAAVARRMDLGTGSALWRTGTKFARYRGDGWQIYLDNPGPALAAAVLILAELRAADGLTSRIAIGLGDATIGRPQEGRPGQDLAAASGSAFIASGRALDALRPPRRMALAGEGVDRLHQRLIAMIDRRTQTWSREQAEATALLMAPEAPLTQAQMAERIGISRQAVAARLAAAEAAEINAAAVDFRFTFGPQEADDD